MDNNSLPKPLSFTHYFQQRNIVLDAMQQQVVSTLEQLIGLPEQKLSVHRRASSAGLYLWGEPGRGKTMLMDALSVLTSPQSLRIHYHLFLRDLHASLAQAHGNRDDHLAVLAADTAREYRVFCLDEFHLHDIADTILMERFLRVLLREGVLVILTSNYQPEQLLPDPLFHERALPTIALIREHMAVMHLDGNKDYRYRSAERLPHYLSPCSENNQQQLMALLEQEESKLQLQQAVTLCGRKVMAEAVGQHAVWFRFDTLCLGPRSHLDYLDLADRWNTIVVSDIHQAGLDKPDGLRRFIWLVDVLYDRRLQLYLTSQDDIAQMLQQVPIPGDMPRTLSRLAEMQSAGFIHSDRPTVQLLKPASIRHA